MDIATHRTTVEGLSEAQRAVFFIVRQHGPVTAPDLRVDGPAKLKTFTDWNGKSGKRKGRMNGSTEVLGALQSKGLLRRLPNKRDSGVRPPAWEYVVVEAEGVEAAADEYRARVTDEAKKPRNGDPANARRRDRNNWSANLREQALYSEWHRHRRRVIELTQALDLMEPLIFVDALYDGHRKEFERVLDEVTDAREWCDRVILELETRDGRRALEHKRDRVQALADDPNNHDGERDAAREKVRMYDEKLNGNGAH